MCRTPFDAGNVLDLFFQAETVAAPGPPSELRLEDPTTTPHHPQNPAATEETGEARTADEETDSSAPWWDAAGWLGERARRMAEAVLRDDAGTPGERAHRMAEAAVLMGEAARRVHEEGMTSWHARDFGGDCDSFSMSYCEFGEESYPQSPTVPPAHGLIIMSWSGRSGTHPHTYPESIRYEGEWRNNKWHGLGVVRWAKGGSIRYAGQWHGHRFHGLGVRRNPEGSVFHAGWWNKDQRSQTASPE